MLFNPKIGQVVFISCREIPKKDKSGTFHIVTVADPNTYENVEFFPKDVNDFSGIEQGELIEVNLDCSGRFNSLCRVDD